MRLDVVLIALDVGAAVGMAGEFSGRCSTNTAALTWLRSSCKCLFDVYVCFSICHVHPLSLVAVHPLVFAA
ncbi:hypothetical protein B0H13DRAFT_1055202 [Mycena leptocephala]|nr:hypothetical protein B0H13DRAFT_1055202 [Mycena leptocephala]